MVVARPGAAVTWPAPVVFFGSPAFAVPSLEALAADARFDVRLAVTQPPKPVGRGGRMMRSAVHEVAERLGIPVWTPERLRGAAALERLREQGATLHVVAAYGKILRRDVLDIPARGTLNVHASLLPAYRGASPITAAILDGAETTGVTIMLLDEGLDTGPMLGRASLVISQQETTPTLTERLATVGASLLVEAAVRWLAGEIEPEAQDDSHVTHTRTLTKEDGQVDFVQSPERLARMERAYTPWPGVYTFLDGKRLILRDLAAEARRDDAPAVTTTAVTTTNGTIVAVDGRGLHVAAGGGILRVGAVQPEGKAAMPATAFAAGRRGLVGMRLGPA